MRIEPDGFKIIEEDDPNWEAIYAMNDNMILLHDQIKELRKLVKVKNGEEMDTVSQSDSTCGRRSPIE